MSEPHKSERVVLVFGSGNKLFYSGFVPYLVQHVQHSFICAAVSRPPERSNTGSDAGIRIGTVDPASRTVEVDAFCS